MSAQSENKPGQVIVVKAAIGVQVYDDAEGQLRWRTRSSARGRRVVGDSGQGYSSKASVLRGLLLNTGGTYTKTYSTRFADGSVYEQGVIRRPTTTGLVEEIFVEYATSQGWVKS